MLKLSKSNKKKLTGWKKILIYVLMVPVIIAGMEIPRHFSVATTDSVGYHFFYFKKGTPETLKNGDFVLFPLNTHFVEDCNPCNVTKIVGCKPGQTLKTEGMDYYCDSKFIGTAKRESKSGIKVDNFVFNGKIPNDKFFATGANADSYDSKYYGLVEKEKIKGTAIPLF